MTTTKNDFEKLIHNVSMKLTGYYQNYSEEIKSDESWDKFSMNSFHDLVEMLKNHYGKSDEDFNGINVTSTEEMDNIFDSIIRTSESICPGINDEVISDGLEPDFTYWSFIDMLWSGLDWGFGENREDGLKRILG